MSPPQPLSLLSVEGPLRPSLSGRVTIALTLALGMAALLVVNPVIGGIVALITVVSARGLLPRWVTTMVAPAAMGLSGAYVALTVLRHRIIPGLEWPSELTRAHPVAWLALFALLVDVVVQAARGRWRK